MPVLRTDLIPSIRRVDHHPLFQLSFSTFTLVPPSRSRKKMSVFTPLEVPVVPENEEYKQHKLNDEQEAKRLEVLSYFDREDYKLPKEEKGELMDEEKMWLVSKISSLILSQFSSLYVYSSPMTAYSGR